MVDQLKLRAGRKAESRYSRNSYMVSAGSHFDTCPDTQVNLVTFRTFPVYALNSPYLLSLGATRGEARTRAVSIASKLAVHTRLVTLLTEVIAESGPSTAKEDAIRLLESIERDRKYVELYAKVDACRKAVYAPRTASVTETEHAKVLANYRHARDEFKRHQATIPKA